MNLQKINWKLNFKNPERIRPDDFFKVFNKWIPDGPEVFVDVADYRHVKDGPWTFLAGYQTDYVLDHSDYKLGFLYNRKRVLEGDNPEKIRQSFHEFLTACKKLVSDPVFKGQLSFRTDEILFLINDRATAPNNQDTFNQISPLIYNFAENLFGQEPIKLDPEQNPKQRFSLTIKTAMGKSLDELLKLSSYIE